MAYATLEVVDAENQSLTERFVERHATLMLADGTCFHGRGFGPSGATGGELVFTTAMTGYQEALTDPSYRGQILMFTYPLIGNYGTAAGRAQSSSVQPSAVVMARLCDTWGEQSSLRSYLLGARVPAIHDIDTRAIAGWIRTNGASAAALMLHDGDPDPEVLRARIDRHDYDRSDFISDVTISQPVTLGSGSRTIAVLDCGNKQRVLDELLSRDTRVVVLPAGTPADEILRLQPDGVVVSNGPGNPAAAPVVDTLRRLSIRLPLFGICLGHQLLALAAGARTFKLKFGHRGANHPVLDCVTGRAFITTQNHGFAVDPDSIPDELFVSHRHLNDGTVEGLRHRQLPIRSVQFHPEGAPGPRDTGAVMDEWLESLGTGT